MDSAENQPSSSSSSRQGRKTPLSSNTHSLNVLKNKPSQSSTNTKTATNSQSQANSNKPTSSDNKRVKKLASDHSASSSEKVKPAAVVRRVSAAHTAPVIGSAHTDDTENDITTDSDMAHTEEDEKSRGNAAVISTLLADLATKKHDKPSTKSSRHVRPVSAQGHHSSSKERGSSRDRHTSHERMRDRHRSRDRGKREREVPALPLHEQDRQEPDGRSSRQGRGEDKSSPDSKSHGRTSPVRHTRSGDRHTKSSDRHATSSDRHATNSDRHATSSDRHATSSDRHSKRDIEPTKAEGRRSGQSLDRGNNTGSSEPPTVIEV